MNTKTVTAKQKYKKACRRFRAILASDHPELNKITFLEAANMWLYQDFSIAILQAAMARCRQMHISEGIMINAIEQAKSGKYYYAETIGIIPA